MDMLEVLEKRHSYRGKYAPSPVPREGSRGAFGREEEGVWRTGVV